MKSALLLAALLLGSCATPNEIRLQLRVTELERQQEALLAFAAKQEQYIRALERGHIQRAKDFAKAVENCEL